MLLVVERYRLNGFNSLLTGVKRDTKLVTSLFAGNMPEHPFLQAVCLHDNDLRSF